jgi:hypothetical protein
MQLDDLDKSNGKVQQKTGNATCCDLAKLPVHYQPKQNPDAHIGAAEDDRWNNSKIELSDRDREVLRDHFGFRINGYRQDY